jgi:hypothetical protein
MLILSRGKESIRRGSSNACCPIGSTSAVSSARRVYKSASSDTANKTALWSPWLPVKVPRHSRSTVHTAHQLLRQPFVSTHWKYTAGFSVKGARYELETYEREIEQCEISGSGKDCSLQVTGGDCCLPSNSPRRVTSMSKATASASETAVHQYIIHHTRCLSQQTGRFC